MLKTNQHFGQKQTQQQKLSPQQIQFVKLLQMPSMGLEQRIKEEMEMNPVLEQEAPEEFQEIVQESEPDAPEEEGEPDPVDQHEDIDWDSFLHNTEYDGNTYSGSSGGGEEEWRDLPNPYHESLLEELEQQVALLDLDEEGELIADQIIGSLDEDGYFRRDMEAVIDNIAFNHGVLVGRQKVEAVRRAIQQLEPVGIASIDLRDCLLAQLKNRASDRPEYLHAQKIMEHHWEAFQKKHFDKLRARLELSDQQLKQAFEVIRGLDPRPGAVTNPDQDNPDYVEPDFEVRYEPDEENDDEGEFLITLSDRNVPPLRISPEYKKMWDSLKSGEGASSGADQRAKEFIREKVESAQWFIDSIVQRQQTLLKTMRAIVDLQKDFFKHGAGLKPMILKDVAAIIGMDISTVSRVVNGKYVQTHFGVYELKYFFSEGIKTEDGEDISSREVKNRLLEIVDNENKQSPLTDSDLRKKLHESGYKVARRTVSKYREQLNIPVARLRKQIL
ncbi:MAG: RNA polymerase factor sigma-54 [Balneolaceae bacterium]